MKRAQVRLSAAGIAVALWASLSGLDARAAVNSISGEAQVKVTQFVGPNAVQTDFSIETVPQTRPEPPAVARARIDRLLSSNEVIAAGQGVAIMFPPNLSGVGNPSDVGLDIGAFTDGQDTSTRWESTATVRQTRSLTLSPSEAGAQFGFGDGRTRSRVLLSGAMLVTAENLGRDLSGVEISFTFSVVRRQAGRDDTTPLAGEIALVGGPNGTVEVGRRVGAFNNVVIPVIDLNAVVPDAPLTKAIVFAGTEFPYEYDFSLNQPFELELLVTATVRTIPGGVGGLATFGTPPEGLGSVLDRVKKNDSGQRMIAAVNERVDTTGEAYVNQPVPLPGFGGLCGSGSAGLLPLMVVGGACAGRFRLRVRRARPGAGGAASRSDR